VIIACFTSASNGLHRRKSVLSAEAVNTDKRYFRVHRVCRIMVPIAAPGIIATAIFALILCWSEFLFAVIFTSSTAQTLPVAMASFVTDRGIEWGKMSAAGSVLIEPLTVLFYSIERFLIRGLSFGAIAG
jgi:multiple sugar transport system permease protein